MIANSQRLYDSEDVKILAILQYYIIWFQNSSIQCESGPLRVVNMFWYRSLHYFFIISPCVTDLMLEKMIASNHLGENERERVQKILLKPHHHQFQKGLHKMRSLADIGKKFSSKHLTDEEKGSNKNLSDEKKGKSQVRTCCDELKAIAIRIQWN